MARDKLAAILRILDAENKLLERADQKSISMLSVLGVFMVFFVVYHRVLPINPFTITMVTLYMGCALGAILSLILAIRPRIRQEQQETDAACPAGEPAFFMGICQYSSLSEYRKAVEELAASDDALPNVYIRQVYSLAKINAVKHKHVQRGALLVIVSLATELTLIAYLFMNYMGSGAIPPIGI